MKNNRKIEVGQVRCLKTYHKMDYVNENYVITSINLEEGMVSVTFINDNDKYRYPVAHVMTDIVVM